MFKQEILFLSLFFEYVSSVPALHQELPRPWQDEWTLGLRDTSFNISATALHMGNENLAVIEIQTFLDNWSVITADRVKRCNICHVFKELHTNILSMYTSDCLSQVRLIS